MPLSTCPRCKKMFNKTAEVPVCSACDADEQAEYEKVREALHKEPGLSMEEAAKAAEVTLAVVQRMLKEGALASTNPIEKVMCGRCGQNAAISAAKKLCQPCLDKLNQEVAQATAAIKLAEKKQSNVGEYLSAKRSFEERGR